MTKRRDGGKLSGSYFYERAGRSLALRGEIDARGNFTLREYDAGGAQTGVFKGHWETNECEGCGDYLTGKWSKPDGTGALRFDLTPYAVAFRGPLKLVTRSFAEKNRRGQPAYEISVEYPQLVGSADVSAARFNDIVRSKVTKHAADHRKDFLGGSDGGEFYLSYFVELANDDLVSVDFNNYFQYGDSGERNAISETFNYDLKRGRVIKFKELFRPGSDYEKLLSDYCLSELKKLYDDGEPHTDYELRGHVENVVGDDRKWAVTPNGLDIIFDSGEMGLYGAGEANIIVPYASLKRVIRPDCPLAAFAR